MKGIISHIASARSARASRSAKRNSPSSMSMRIGGGRPSPNPSHKADSDLLAAGTARHGMTKVRVTCGKGREEKYASVEAKRHVSAPCRCQSPASIAFVHAGLRRCRSCTHLTSCGVAPAPSLRDGPSPQSTLDEIAMPKILDPHEVKGLHCGLCSRNVLALAGFVNGDHIPRP